MLKRYQEIDTLRGIAVFLMVASHIVWFQSNGQNAVWNFMRSWGDAVCYITFLFVFGMTLYLSLSKADPSKKDPRKNLRRIGTLVGIYYLTAFVSLLPAFKEGVNLITVFKTLVFINVPGFTEFLLPFFMYTGIILVVSRFVTLSKLASIKGLIVSAVIYCIGLILFFNFGTVELPFGLESYPAIVWGHQYSLRFPLLEYMPVLVLGMYWGRKLVESEREELLTTKVLCTFFVVYIITIVLWFCELLWSYRYLNEFFRWPPSVLFLAVGLAFALFSLWLLRFVELGIVSNFFRMLGRRSLGVMAFHLIFLRLLELINVGRTGGFIILLGLFIIVLLGYPGLKMVATLLKHEYAV